MSKARCAAVLVMMLVLMIPAAANAVPDLTLFIPEEYGGSFNTTTETWITSSSSFVLDAIVDDYDIFRGAPDVDLYLCVSLYPELFTRIDDTKNITFNDGLNITINGIALTASDFEYGIPPISDLNPDGGGGDLGPHSIFPTAFAQFVINIDSPGTYEFLIENAVPGIHFDLYTLTSLDRIDYFAPFSHDAEVVTPPVPEPATLTLLGSGLLLLPAGAFLQKKRTRKKCS